LELGFEILEPRPQTASVSENQGSAIRSALEETGAD
jgi:hypothetical protein